MKVLYLDIDGVLNPWDAVVTPTAWPDFKEHKVILSLGSGFQQRFDMWLSAEMGAAIDALIEAGVEVIWATTWAENANRKIGSRIGIRTIPYLKYDIVKDQSDIREQCGKLPYVSEHWEANWEPGSVGVWVDDNLGPLDFTYCRRQQDRDRNLYGLNPHPALGLTPEMLQHVRDMLCT